jgi:outer membrane protein TolC
MSRWWVQPIRVAVAADARARRRGTAPRRAARCACAAAAILLGACASYQPAPLDAAAAAQKFSARRLDAAEVRQRIARALPGDSEPWPPRQWDRAQLLVAALALNPTLAVARVRVEAALAHEGAAAQQPNPQLTLQSEYARDEPHPWLYGLGLELLLPSSQRRELQVQLARMETSSARWDLLDEAWAVRRALVAALSEHEAATRQLRLLEQLAGNQDALVELERRRVAAGETDSSGLLAAGRARIEIEQQRAQAQAAAAAAQSALAAVLGVAPAALDDIAWAWPEWGDDGAPDEATLASARAQALRSRADLGAAIDAYAAAENRLHQAVLAQYPQIHLSPGYYWDHGIAKLPLDAAFELPLFHRHEGEIAEARAARELAGARMLATQATIIGAIDAALRAEGDARASLDAGARSLESLRRQRRQNATALRLGAIDASEDLAALVLVLRGELGVVELRARWQAARNALEDALHAPLSGPELKLSAALPVATSGAQP